MQFTGRLILTAWALGMIASAPLSSQVAISGKITGFISDSTGAGVGGATITVSGSA